MCMCQLSTSATIEFVKVALVHDYLREYGGAERVLEALHETFPQAPVYVAYFNPKSLGSQAKRFSGWDIRTSWYQSFPFADKFVSPMRIFAPMMFESFDFSEYDVVISSSAIYFAKAVITKPKTLHIGYIHTPPKYLYGYATSFNYKRHWWTMIGAEFLNHFLRIYDYETSQRPDVLVANSKNVAERIKKFYRREAEIIFPPVNLSEFKGAKKKIGEYFVSLNRLWKGKGTDITIKACSQLNFPLKVAGEGPELSNLKKIAGKNVQFLGSVTDQERVKLLSEARALIVAVEDEDFGINAVEAFAAGTPVIAIKTGGYLETVIAGKTGEFFPSAGSGQVQETVENLVKVLETFDPKKYKPEDCIKQASKFSKERFQTEILELVEENLKD